MKDRLIYAQVEQASKKSSYRRVVERLRTRNYDVSENTSYKLLEQHLEITFPNVPKRILLTRNNAELHYERYGSFDHGESGHYVPNIDAYFIPVNTQITTEIHENMHGFMAYFNRYFRKDMRVSPFAPKKPLIYIAFSEGVARWATAAVLEKMITERKERGEDTRDLRNMMGDGFPKPPSEEDVITLNAYINEIRRKAFAPAISRENQSAFDRAATFATELGFAFVTSVMNTLVNSGMSIKDALITIISNPPKKLKLFGRPEEYAQQLLAKHS